MIFAGAAALVIAVVGLDYVFSWKRVHKYTEPLVSTEYLKTVMYADPERSWRHSTNNAATGRDEKKKGGASETLIMLAYCLGSVVSSVSLVTMSKMVFRRRFAFPMTCNFLTYYVAVPRCHN